MFTKEQLKQQMQEMGLTSRDTVMIHTSLRAIGEVENGADGVIDAFCEYLKDGLFLVPTHTWANVNQDQPVYDVNKTVPCIGTLPRVATFRKDGIRSLHPTHSVWAHGKGAEEFIANEENIHTPMTEGFVWSRLAKVHAKILLIGVRNDKNTFIHTIDELADLPDRLRTEPYDVKILDWEGKVHNSYMRGHFCSRSDDVSRQYVNFEKPLMEMGAQTFGKLGNAEVRIVDAALCQEVILRIYSRAKEDLCIEYREIPRELYEPSV